MMYFRLAFKNVKRSIKDYLIYIITLTACISLFYAFLSITSRYYRPDIGAEFNLDILGDGIKYAGDSIDYRLLLMFLMQYVNHFMIQRRKREFAVQSIIGMEQSTIARLFFMESLIMGLFSLVVGNCIGWCFFTIYYCHVAAGLSETICVFVYVVSGYNHFNRFLFLALVLQS